MNPNTSTAPEPEPTTAPAPIAALPTPTAEEVLQAKLAESEAREAKIAGQLADITKSLTQATVERDKLSERLKAHEKNAFSFAIANIKGGEILHEAGSELARITELVSQRGEPGELIVKMRIKPHQGCAFEFNADVKAKEPKIEPFRAIIYRTESGDLVRQDPRQRELGI